MKVLKNSRSFSRAAAREAARGPVYVFCQHDAMVMLPQDKGERALNNWDGKKTLVGVYHGLVDPRWIYDDIAEFVSDHG